LLAIGIFMFVPRSARSITSAAGYSCIAICLRWSARWGPRCRSSSRTRAARRSFPSAMHSS
jgi:hypothetical protein